MIVIYGNAPEPEVETAARRSLLARGVPADTLGQGTLEEDKDTGRFSLRGFIGNNAVRLIDRIKESDSQTIQLDITSGGGFVTAGAALHDGILDAREGGKTIVTNAEGLVGSAATLPFVAGARRQMGTGAQLMAHAPFAVILTAVGLANLDGMTDELRNFLQPAQEAILRMYTAAGVREAEQYLDGKDHFMSPEQAYKAGFVTKEPAKRPPAGNQIRESEDRARLGQVLRASKDAMQPTEADERERERRQIALTRQFNEVYNTERN